jgi:hypothetical protein
MPWRALLWAASFSPLACAGKVDSTRAQESVNDPVDASSSSEAGVSSSYEAGSSHPVVTPPPDGSSDSPEAGSIPPFADDAGCPVMQSVMPVWHSTDTGFTYSSSGGYADILVDAGCTWLASEYDFAIVDGVGSLAEKSCGYNGPVNRSATLTADQKAQIVAKLNELLTVCNMNCGADAPQVTLTIGATTYNSDFYSGCGTPPPYISFDALTGLADLADNILSEACSDGGTVVGTCTTGAADGG